MIQKQQVPGSEVKNSLQHKAVSLLWKNKNFAGLGWPFKYLSKYLLHSKYAKLDIDDVMLTKAAFLINEASSLTLKIIQNSKEHA